MQYAFRKLNYLYSLLAGASLVLSLAPVGLFPIAYISPAILFFLLLRSNRRSQSVKLGWAFGVGLFGAGASWVFQSMYSFAQAPLALAAFLTFLFVLGLALQIAFFGFIVSFFNKCLVISRLLVIYPAAWVFVEWCRGWLFTGFPWLYLGHSQIDTWFAHYAPVGGSLLVSWVTAIIAGALVTTIAGQNSERYHQVNLPAANYVRVSEPLSHWSRGIAAAVVLALVAGAWLLSLKHWVVPTGDNLKVSLIQANIAQDQKWLPEQRVPSVERYMSMTRKHWDSDLIVWPETAIPGRFAEFNDFVLAPMYQESIETNTNLVVGGFHETESGQFKNSAIVLGDDVDEVDIYSKRHLVPLGEYIPLLKYLRWLDKWMNIPYDNLSSGGEDGLLTIGKHRAQMSICYEDAFGEEIIDDLPEADYLINITNDGWFSGSLQPYQHMQIARFRALEAGRYLLRATNTGVSGIVDHRGKVINTIPAYEQGVVSGEMMVLSGSTPYVKFGNYLVVILSSLLLLILFAVSRKNRNIL
ncbi:apolipoprotein N-acyltransferase [Leucothrix pacifica]|uniref:Apolipoprotein N-acyltransferase n=1 Tax=Leucothrix pacifica TaxID=1247513 RepID=A0A317CLN6_9GAMM|nr:apolipoprotein N-acyltransferase [Leucothrix pacifica]PWQ97200.1 apolipoprotein N-acyltransferase [Leucothrix pacifica]